MSHGIEFNKKTQAHSFATASPAWHNLGTVFGRKMASNEALNGANLNFTVNKAKNHIFVGTRQPIEGISYTTYREDNLTPLGTVGEGYTIVQNHEGFDFIDILAGKENKMIIDSAGALRNGESIFITAKLPKYIKLFGEDLTEMYVVFTNNHTGKGGISALITPIRVVCNNTLVASLKQNRKINLKHTKNVHEKIKMADKIMGKTEEYTKSTQELFEALAKQTVNEQQVDHYLSRYFLRDESFEIAKQHNFNYDTIDKKMIPTARINDIQTAKEYHENGPGQQKIKGTLFGIYNTISGFQQNVKKFKTEDNKMESIIYEGAEFRKQNKLLKRLMEDSMII